MCKKDADSAAVKGTTTLNRRRWHNAGPMLGQRRRRWPNIRPALCQRLVFPMLLLNYPDRVYTIIITRCTVFRLTA